MNIQCDIVLKQIWLLTAGGESESPPFVNFSCDCISRDSGISMQAVSTLSTGKMIGTALDDDDDESVILKKPVRPSLSIDLLKEF